MVRDRHLAGETCQLQSAGHKSLFCKAGMTRCSPGKERGLSRHVTGLSLVLDTLSVLCLLCCHVVKHCTLATAVLGCFQYGAPSVSRLQLPDFVCNLQVDNWPVCLYFAAIPSNKKLFEAQLVLLPSCAVAFNWETSSPNKRYRCWVPNSLVGYRFEGYGTAA